VAGKEMGCVGSSTVFQMAFGDNPHLLISSLTSYDPTGSLATVSISDPFARMCRDRDHESEAGSKLISGMPISSLPCLVHRNESEIDINISALQFHLIGFIDGYRESNDNGRGYSVIDETRLFDRVVPRGMKLVRFYFVDSNAAPWRETRDRSIRNRD